MATCASCGADIPEGHETVFQGRGKNAKIVTMCSSCATALERSLQDETEAPNLLGALTGGLVAGLVSCLVWYGVVVLTGYELGFLAMGVGWLVAQGVMFGAGRKRGPRLQVLSVVITLVAMALSEYFIVRHFVVEAFREEGYTGFRLFLPLRDMFEVILEGIKADPLILLFWGLALLSAFTLPMRRRLLRASV